MAAQTYIIYIHNNTSAEILKKFVAYLMLYLENL